MNGLDFRFKTKNLSQCASQNITTKKSASVRFAWWINTIKQDRNIKLRYAAILERIQPFYKVQGFSHR